MGETKTIHVTQEDIDQGIPEAPTACPIWYALTRQLTFAAKEDPFFEVNGDEIEFYDDAGRPPQKVPLPDAAQLFVQAFDNEDDVEPFAFELELPKGW